jgi:hypothetical protein
MLLSDKADLTDPALTDALRRYFDRSSVLSTRVQYCGIALVGFDAPFYPADNVQAVADEIVAASLDALTGWRDKIGARLLAEKLSDVEIQLCAYRSRPRGFRAAFLKSMGLKGE